MIKEGLLSRGCNGIKSDTNDTHSCQTNSCCKLNTFDWLKDLNIAEKPGSLVEVRFKNTRKGIYKNVNDLQLKNGDIVAVESSPGHDIGVISLTGELVFEQLRRGRVQVDSEFKKVYRKAKATDLDKWKESIDLEEITMLKARKISERLRLNMKIGDVEYQGDKTKAIFYYIAEDRVDFRELIKILAEEFKIRIEMRQIGARQEAGRIGGIGACGRELCCSTWMSNFISVTTNSARYQEVSLNPQKLAGQCGKLKCCLNYELDTYLDAQKDFPDTSIPLETIDGIAHHFKTDVFRRIMWYAYGKENGNKIVTLSVDRVKETIAANKKGSKSKLIEEFDKKEPAETIGFKNVIGEDSITRFEEKRKGKDNNRRKFIKKPNK